MEINKKQALEIERYPVYYQRYLEEEKRLVESFVTNEKNVLDVGCGTGRIIPYVAPIVRSYVGIDIDKNCLEEAERISKRFPNARIINIDVKSLKRKFKENEFDSSICLWNTIGCVNNDAKALRNIAFVTRDSCLLTVIAKGTLDKRKAYYENFQVNYTIDSKNETIYSAVWGESRAYSKEEIIGLCQRNGFRVRRISKIEDLAFCLILDKEEKNAKS